MIPSKHKIFNKILSSLIIIIFICLFVQYSYSQGYQSTYHQNNIGKIAFASKMIPLKNPESVGLKTTFNPSEFIYGRVFANSTPITYLVGGQQIKCYDYKFVLAYFLYLDGKLIPTNLKTPLANKCIPNAFFTQALENNDRCSKWNSWRLYLAASVEDNSDLLDPAYPEFRGTANAFKEVLAKLTPGKHTIKIEVRPSSLDNMDLQGDLIAEGEFTINATAEGIKALLQQSPFPVNKYTAADYPKVREQAINALSEKLGVKPLEIGFMSTEFVEARFTDTWEWYRKIAVWAAWDDDDGDGYGSVRTYNLIATQKADGSWSKLSFSAYANDGFSFIFPMSSIKNK